MPGVEDDGDRSIDEWGRQPEVQGAIDEVGSAQRGEGPGNTIGRDVAFDVESKEALVDSSKEGSS